MCKCWGSYRTSLFIAMWPAFIPRQEVPTRQADGITAIIIPTEGQEADRGRIIPHGMSIVDSSRTLSAIEDVMGFAFIDTWGNRKRTTLSLL